MPVSPTFQLLPPHSTPSYCLLQQQLLLAPINEGKAWRLRPPSHPSATSIITVSRSSLGVCVRPPIYPSIPLRQHRCLFFAFTSRTVTVHAWLSLREQGQQDAIRRRRSDQEKLGLIGQPASALCGSGVVNPLGEGICGKWSKLETEQMRDKGKGGSTQIERAGEEGGREAHSPSIALQCEQKRSTSEQNLKKDEKTGVPQLPKIPANPGNGACTRRLMAVCIIRPKRKRRLRPIKNPPHPTRPSGKKKKKKNFGAMRNAWLWRERTRTEPKTNL